MENTNKPMITFDDIKKANASLKTTDIHGKDYVEVNQRIKAFRMCYPCGTITTEIVNMSEGGVLMKAIVSDDYGKVLGTGFAMELKGASTVNKTSFIENCETSAVGRALGMCGFGIDTSVASADEVINAIEQQNTTPEPEPIKLDENLLAEAQSINLTLEKLSSYFKKDISEITNEDLAKGIALQREAIAKVMATRANK